MGPAQIIKGTCSAGPVCDWVRVHIAWPCGGGSHSLAAPMQQDMANNKQDGADPILSAYRRLSKVLQDRIKHTCRPARARACPALHTRRKPR